MKCYKLVAIAWITVCFFNASSVVYADTVVVDEIGDQFANVGDYELIRGNDPISAPGQVTQILNMGNAGTSDMQSGSLTAGQLWQFFQSAGFSSIGRIYISLGINETGPVGTNFVNVNQMLIEIENPFGPGNIFTSDLDAGGDNTVQVFNYHQGTSDAEMVAQALLGFDFMSVFNAASPELVTLTANVSERTDGFEIFFVTVPEPSTATALLFGVGIFGFLRRRKRN